MENKNNFVFKILTIIAWAIFFGICIEAGALLFNFIYSFFNPLGLKNLYQKLDLSDLYNRSKNVYFFIYSFVLIIGFMKAILFYTVIKLVDKLDLDRPFSNFVSMQISRISYITLFIGIFSFLVQKISQKLQYKGYPISQMDKFWVDSQAYILMAAVIYIIAVIFKRGIALLNEKDSTAQSS